MDEELEKLTEEILIKNDIYKIPADIAVIAEKNNINVYKVEMPNEKVLGAIRREQDTEQFIIMLNKNMDLNQIRFTLAHELGHFFLHKELLEKDTHIDILHRITNENEKEVEYFAGALLMNRELLKRVYENNQNIAELAVLFEVSEAEMTKRLMILGLI